MQVTYYNSLSIYFSFFIFIYLSFNVFFFISIYVYMFIIILIHLFLSPSIYSYIELFIYLDATRIFFCHKSIYSSIYLYIYSIYQFIHQSTNLLIYLSIYYSPIYLGATREIGSCLTRIVLRHKSMESRMKTLCSALLDCMVLPLQDKMEEWKKVSHAHKH